MPTVSEYREKLNKATLANDQGAIEYFKSQIAKGEAMPPPGAAPVPQGGSIMDPLAQGASLGFADEIGGGVAGLYDLVTGGGKGFGKAYAETRDDMRTKADEYGQRNPVTSFMAELVSGAGLPLGAARTAAQGIRLGAGAGAVTGAGKAETMEDIPGDAVAGGVLGGAGAGVLSAGQGLFRAIVPRRAQKATTPTHEADVDRLAQAGIPTTPAERLGSRSAREAEKDTAAYFGAGDELETRPAQVRQALMDRAGFTSADIEAGDLSPDSLRRARDYFSGEYDTILNGTQVDLADMDRPLQEVERRFFRQLMGHEQKAEVRRILDDFRDDVTNYEYEDAAGNILMRMPGREYKRIRSNLGKRGQQLAKQSGPNASLAPVYREMQGALDTAFRANAPAGLVRRLADVDSQYRHYAFLRDVQENPDNIDAIAKRIMSSNVDDDLKALVKAYQNVVIKSGGEGAGRASGNIMPPVLSMARAAGAMRPNMPQSVDNAFARMPEGVGAGALGQSAGMFGPDEAHSGRQRQSRAARRARSKQRRRDEG